MLGATQDRVAPPWAGSADPDPFVLVAEVGGRIIGFGIAAPCKGGGTEFLASRIADLAVYAS